MKISIKGLISHLPNRELFEEKESLHEIYDIGDQLMELIWYVFFSLQYWFQ